MQPVGPREASGSEVMGSGQPGELPQGVRKLAMGHTKTRRNDSCPGGSCKKYKRCCLAALRVNKELVLHSIVVMARP